MRTLLVEAGIITSYIFAHLHTDTIIYSVMDTTPFTNDYVTHIYVLTRVREEHRCQQFCTARGSN